MIVNKILCLLLLVSSSVSATESLRIPLTPTEKVWGGIVADGAVMPFPQGYSMDFGETNKANQLQPIVLTNEGQYLWSETPFTFTLGKDEIAVTSPNGKVISGRAGTSLRDAYKHVSNTYFPPSGAMPDTMLFAAPQYNTWIELNFNHNQADILSYARSIVANGLPTGVLMIDDTWQEDFGVWLFHPGRFPDPKGMIDELHGMGFKVMLWICPFISPDQTRLYQKLAKEQALLRESNGKDPVMIRWWDGVSAVLDFSNPLAVEWFQTQLDRLVTEYSIDGFKFDAGDFDFYPADAVSTGNVNANTQAELYARIGLNYPLNEYRACWKMGGQPLAQRLADKQHSWNDLRMLIPGMVAEGLAGYPFSCPDMIGGGEISAFEGNDRLDQELIARSAQCHALMPMMQFSVAPWRVLDKRHLEVVKTAVTERKKLTPTIVRLAAEAAKTGEPILRSMEYVFPGQGFDQEKSQFMLGDTILVAPVLERGVQSRTVKLPRGRWKDETGKIYKGGKTITIFVPLERLPYFTTVK